MRKLLFILAVCLLSSCGIFKKVNKSNTLDQVESSSIVKSETNTITVDQSITTVKEKAEGVVTVPEKTITQQTTFNMDSLVNGMTAVKNDLIDIRFILNPVTNRLTTTATLKPHDVPFLIDKETTTRNNINTNAKASSREEDKKKDVHKTNHVQKEPVNTFWIAIIVLGVAAIVVFAAYKRFGG